MNCNNLILLYFFFCYIIWIIFDIGEYKSMLSEEYIEFYVETFIKSFRE